MPPISTIHRLAFAGTLFSVLLAAISMRAAPATNSLEVQSVEVNGYDVHYQHDHEVNLGVNPKNVIFRFGAPTNAPHSPVRVQWKMDGVDPAWHEGKSEMTLTVRFYNSTGDRIGQTTYPVQGDSTGWCGNVGDSLLTHRRETLAVPPGAWELWIVLSSAGPASTTGIYAIDNLIVYRPTTNSEASQILLRYPATQRADVAPENSGAPGWLRDGTHPSMAKVLEVGASKTKALALLDEDPFGHAEWHNHKAYAPHVSPGEQLVVEWNEVYSIGESESRSYHYNGLPPGHYHFRLAEADIFGKHLAEKSIAVFIPVPLWEMPWFWVMVAIFTIGASAMSARYVARQRLQRTMTRIQQQRALEEERLRIARDIHDDLGARITQISLLSAMAQNDSTFSETKARAQFDRISVMSRDLVSALYETVWAVNPENDNLDAMVNYLCERINEFCGQAQLRCRLNVPSLPKNIVVSSRTRHNISMVVREAMHNVIKHAGASQVTVHFTLADSTLAISIHDDGRGFQTAEAPAGNGLKNMKGRMYEIGGSCEIESSTGQGTTIQLRLPVQALDERDLVANGSTRDTSSPVTGEFE